MLLRLQKYSFDLVYVPGSKLILADTLSRAPVFRCGTAPPQVLPPGDIVPI